MYTQAKPKNQNPKQKLIKIISGVIIFSATLFLVTFQAKAGYTEHDIATTFTGADLVYPADIDGDGHMDILAGSTSTGEIAWWKNNDSQGTGTNWTKQVIASGITGLKSIYAADLDKDGKMEVLTATNGSGGGIAWRKDNGTSSWDQHDLIGGVAGQNFYARDVYAADVNQDGKVDVLGTNTDSNYPRVYLWKNNGGGSFASVFQLFPPVTVGQVRVANMNPDQDGNLDIVATAGSSMHWWKYTGSIAGWPGNYTNWTKTDLTAGIGSFYLEDLDNNGKVDILRVKNAEKQIAWYQNDSGTFATEKLVGNFITSSGLAQIQAQDIDGDGDMDVLAVGHSIGGTTNKEIVWWANNGDGTSWAKHTVVNNRSNAQSAYATDIDGDGYTDIVGADLGTGKITWWSLNKEDLGEGAGGAGAGGVVVGNGDNLNNKNKVYTNDNTKVYQFEWDGDSWNRTEVGTADPTCLMEDLALGDGNRDGDNEVYATCGWYVYQFKYSGGSWAKSQVYLGTALMHQIIFGDGDNNTDKELYVTVGSESGSDLVNYVYQFEWNGSSWNAPVNMGSGVGWMQGIALGDADGDSDNSNKVYAANDDGCLYRFKWNSLSWDKLKVGCTEVGDMGIQIDLGDGDKDGKNEIYVPQFFAMTQDNHVYQFKCTTTNCDQDSDWSRTSVGTSTAKQPMNIVALGDADNNGSSEIYTSDYDLNLGNKNHLYQMKCTGDCSQITGWETDYLGLYGPTSIFTGIVVGDGDNDTRNEVYIATHNHAYQYHVKTKHGAKGLLAGFKATTSNGIDAGTVGLLGLQDISFSQDGTTISTFRVNFSQECDWSDVGLGVSGNKAFTYIPAGHTEIFKPFDLYIPKGTTASVRICQGAQSLDEVKEGCYTGSGNVTAEYTFAGPGTDPVVVGGTIEETPHLSISGNSWVVTGLMGSGGQGEGEGGEGAVPEFTWYTIIIAAVLGFGVYLLIRKRNSHKISSKKA